MPTINKQGYLVRRSGRSNYRNWWLVKWKDTSCGFVPMSLISIPKRYIGKRIRFKLEVIDDE